jgi:putative ABC transport system ATP-binding protein
VTGENDTIIKIEDLHKVYDLGEVKVHALRGVSIEVHRGEFVAVMGASGSGKSTFMNIVGCLDRPTEGKYFLESVDASTLSKDELADIRNRKIGFVFQGFNLLSRTTAVDNVELPLLYAGLDGKGRRTRSLQALRDVGLEGREYHMPNQLSGGQQQRVAIARALVNNPSIILADEPTGNLDSRTSVEVMDIFQKLNDRYNITIVLVTHEHDIARYTKRNVIFKDGRIRQDVVLEERTSAEEELKRLPVLAD